MSLKWIDSLELALVLLDKYPDQDPEQLHFTQLREWIVHLEPFDDDINHCNERILEAVQQCWIEEK